MSSHKGQNYYNFTGLEEYDIYKCIRLPLKFEYVVVDIETTGLTTSSEIIEVCALHIIDGNVVDKYSSLIDYPDRKSLPKKITELTGITLDMMREEGGYVEDVLLKLKNFISDKVIICHNAKFDLGFLIQKMYKYIDSSLSNEFIDTLYISREFLSDEIKNHKLPTIAKHFNIDTTNLHRAEGDCIITYQVYENLKELLTTELQNNIQGINQDNNTIQNQPTGCFKISFLILGLIFFTPITLSYLVWKYVNGGKPIKIVIISLIWFIALLVLVVNM
ncbi:MAG: 3'-5' exonuclease [Clostridiales bacterium]|nr:3'-5' exonuclease [Clostridiales bacterium]